MLGTCMTLPTSNGISWLAWQGGPAVCPVVGGSRGALSCSQQSFLHSQAKQKEVLIVREERVVSSLTAADATPAWYGKCRLSGCC